MEAGPRNFAAVNLHGVKNCHWSDFTGARGIPFDVLELAHIGIVLKLVGDSILIVMPRASAGFGIGNVVICHHNSVDGDIVFLCYLLQPFNRHIDIVLIKRGSGFEVRAYRKSICP